MRSEEEIKQERNHWDSIISREEKRLMENLELESTSITDLKDPKNLFQGEEYSQEMYIYRNGVMRGRLIALDWVLGEIDNMSDYD